MAQHIVTKEEYREHRINAGKALSHAIDAVSEAAEAVVLMDRAFDLGNFIRDRHGDVGYTWSATDQRASASWFKLTDMEAGLTADDFKHLRDEVVRLKKALGTRG